MKIIKTLAWIGGIGATFWALKKVFAPTTKVLIPAATPDPYASGGPLQGKPNMNTNNTTSFTGTSSNGQVTSDLEMLNAEGPESLEMLNTVGPKTTKRYTHDFDGENGNDSEMLNASGSLKSLFNFKPKTKHNQPSKLAGKYVEGDTNLSSGQCAAGEVEVNNHTSPPSFTCWKKATNNAKEVQPRYHCDWTDPKTGVVTTVEGPCPRAKANNNWVTVFS